MPVTYPAQSPSLSGDTYNINRFLNTPEFIARRLRELPEQRFIGDTILSGRYAVSGGSVTFETGESIYTVDLPRAVAPGSEYPITTVGNGVAQVASTVKWGQDAIVTDESIARLNWQPVLRSLTKLANQSVRFVDSIAVGAVATAVTNNTAAAANWVTTATGAQILADILNAQAAVLSQNQGYSPDTVLVSDAAYAAAFGKLMAAGLLPREAGNPVLGGGFPEFLGLQWIRTPNLPAAGQALLLDSKVLGGMADEDLGGDGYATTDGLKVQVKSFREEVADQWRIRARRTVVPIIVEPAAAWKITGVGA